jgi:uncharacterized membrane-anchored protein YhcB (DUF1043 family)
MSKPAYVPPTEFMMEVILSAMDWQNDLAKSLQDEVKQLKEERKLLKDTFTIQAELLKRSEYQVEQLKKEINRLNKRLIQNECPF